MPIEPFTPETLQAISQDFEQSAPQDVLRWAVETFGDQLAVVTSFQPTGIVTLHMLSEIAPRTAVLTLDTGLLFPETYALIDTLEARLSLNLIRIRPAQTVSDQAERHQMLQKFDIAEANMVLVQVVPLVIVTHK